MRVLIIEDDIKIAKLLTQGFTDAGFSAHFLTDGAEGLRVALLGHCALLVADVMLPGLDGFSLVEALRKENIQTPVLFLSAKRSTENRIEGLQRGGDDYMVKPFSLSEVIVRAQTILRRTSNILQNKTLRFDDLELDLMSRKAKRGDILIELHQKEFALLELLMSNPEQVLSKTQILEKVWNYDFHPQTNVVDVLICRLRNKIDRSFDTKIIKTVRGVGYAVRKN